MPERLVVPPRRRRWEDEAPEGGDAPPAAASLTESAPPPLIAVEWVAWGRWWRPRLVLPWPMQGHGLELGLLPALAALCAAGAGIVAAGVVAGGLRVPFGGWLWGFAPAVALEAVLFTLASVVGNWPLAWRAREVLALAAIACAVAAWDVGSGDATASFGARLLAACLAPAACLAACWGVGIAFGLISANLLPDLPHRPAGDRGAWCGMGQRQALAYVALVAGLFMIGGQLWGARASGAGAVIGGALGLGSAIVWAAALSAYERRERLRAADEAAAIRAGWRMVRAGAIAAVGATACGLLVPADVSPLARFRYFDFFADATDALGWVFARRGAWVELPILRAP
ncbi:MAG TPA: hypothetical protein VF234_03165, partial [Limnochordia bacterium]